ncbi:MAG: hypothetical protein MUO50_18180, partial [Longimicrobiales bacterium]|nr:hypothetical protein [Longimicrobiales bacterium]
RAELMLLKLTGGNVDAGGNRPIAAALAYQYAIENGADILSMSFSPPNGVPWPCTETTRCRPTS